jgi:SAM-dependent methyltransferase
MVHEGQSALAYRQERVAHWHQVAQLRWRGLGGYYQRRLARVYRLLVPPGQKVLEIGCGGGELLAALSPRLGIGVDLAPAAVAKAGRLLGPLRFIQADAHDLPLQEKFDFIILSDLINDVWDVQSVLEQCQKLCTPKTRLVLNFYSRVWEWPLKAAERLGLARPTLPQNWLTVPDIRNLLDLAGFQILRSWQEVLCPLPLPPISGLCNRFLVRFPPFRWLAMTNFVVARPQPRPVAVGQTPSVSVVVPARNEAGTVEAIFKHTPEMGGGTELIFVEGHSHDGTAEAVESAIRRYPQRQARLLRQTGTGKGDAVRLGFSQASGDVLMILDADLTVAPEDLPRFYEALVSGKGEFINGVRLVYPTERKAMRLINLGANKFFSWAFSWLIGQTVKDTLCGTKVLYKDDYELLAANRAYFGHLDPFGDFDLLFGAAKLNLKIVDMPIRYRQRTYGTTNIRRWKHGLLLLRMLPVAARRLKFV